MEYHNTIFRQLLTFIPHNRFQATVGRHQGDHRIRTLSCWDQFVTLLFGQLLGRSENAIKIQIMVTMIAYLLIKITQLTGKLSPSLQQIFRLTGINLTIRDHL